MSSNKPAAAVGVIRTKGFEYSPEPPYNPERPYPESPWPVAHTGVPNPAYEGVRKLFVTLGYDVENFGKPCWNPLGWLVQPGDTVVLKPNMIKESHPRDPAGWRYILTHGSFVRAVADYVAIALQGTGRMVVCDAPQTDSSFAQVCKILGLDQLCSYYREKGIGFDLIDLRQEEWESQGGAIVRRRKLPGDPRGGVAFDLGSSSEFTGHPGSGRYYGADYDVLEVNAHHQGGHHEYLLSKSVMEADVFINLPKLKTHKKTGITVALKNLVGINADKNWLPHHTEGTPESGGDEFPNRTRRRDVERTALKLLRCAALHYPAMGGRLLSMSKTAGRSLFGDSGKVIRAGNWHGNDTAWRMCLDLNKILFYGRQDGTLSLFGGRQVKRYLALVDGILAGEGNGPLDPDPFPAGLILGGINPVHIDSVAAVLMGYDPDKIPLLANAFRIKSYPLTEAPWGSVEVVSNVRSWSRRLEDIKQSDCLEFRPHFGWEGQIERTCAALPA